MPNRDGKPSLLYRSRPIQNSLHTSCKQIFQPKRGCDSFWGHRSCLPQNRCGACIRPCGNWWEQRGLNPWPPACKAGALPTELYSHENLDTFFIHTTEVAFGASFCSTTHQQFSATEETSLSKQERPVYFLPRPKGQSHTGLSTCKFHPPFRICLFGYFIFPQYKLRLWATPTQHSRYTRLPPVQDERPCLAFPPVSMDATPQAFRVISHWGVYCGRRKVGAFCCHDVDTPPDVVGGFPPSPLQLPETGSHLLWLSSQHLALLPVPRSGGVRFIHRDGNAHKKDVKVLENMILEKRGWADNYDPSARGDGCQSGTRTHGKRINSPSLYQAELSGIIILAHTQGARKTDSHGSADVFRHAAALAKATMTPFLPFFRVC